MENNPVIAIAPIEQQKIAALLFDYIIPMGDSLSVPSEVNYESKCSSRLPIKHLGTISKNEIFKIIDLWLIKNGRSGKIQPSKIKDVLIENAQDIANETDNFLTSRFHQTLTLHGVRSVPIFHKAVEYDNYMSAGNDETVEIKLVRAKVIDTSSLEWSQIIEIRRDSEFTIKLRNFRLFMTDNYSGKDALYIADDLARKLEAYREGCKMHGLELVTATLSKTLDSKSLLGSLTIATAAALAGKPLLLSAALACGTVIEIGKMAVHVAEKKLEFHRNQKNQELSYLIDIENTITKEKATNQSSRQ